jgi:hypothetical protein
LRWCRPDEGGQALYYEFEPKQLLHDDWMADPERTAESHGEIYLELFALDLEDPTAIAKFASDYSVLEGNEMYERSKRAEWRPSPYTRERRRYPSERRRRYESARREHASRDDLPLRTEIETLLEFRLAAYTLRALTRKWLELSRGVDMRASITEQELEVLWLAQASTSLTSVLPAMLRNSTPAIETRRGESSHRRGTPIIEVPVRVAPLFEVCAFELFNHISENAIYLRCQNENCGRPFVHQHGRAIHGQSRSQGVKYCSHHCAQAAAARTYRRRRAMGKRANKDETGAGTDEAGVRA